MSTFVAVTRPATLTSAVASSSATAKEMPSLESSLNAETSVAMFLALAAQKTASSSAVITAVWPIVTVEWE